MKLFIRQAFFFVIPIALLLISIEYTIRQIPNDYSYKNNYLNNNSENIKILVLGNSHSFYGINPDYFSKHAFNAAYVSQSLKYDLFILNKYKNRLNSLNTLVLPISYFTLFSQLENGIEDWRTKNYMIYYGCHYHYDLKYNLEIIGSAPSLVFKKIYQFFKRKNFITVSELGFGLAYSNSKQSDLIATGFEAARRHTTSNLDLLGTNLLLLNELIERCKVKGINIILFTPPARKSYTSNLNKHQLAVMKSTINKIVQENSNVLYLDFMNDNRFVDDDFQDADHLNGIGAKKLTQLIDQIIIDQPKISQH